MADSGTPPAEPQNDENALDGPATTTDLNAPVDPGTAVDGIIDTTGNKGKGPKKKRGGRFNIYLALFIFILVIAGVIVSLAYFQSKKAASSSTVKTESLTQQALQQVANTDATVGQTSQVLNVESSAVFAGKVLVRDSLEAASSLQVGGTTALTDLTVSGPSDLADVQVSGKLSVSSDTAIQGALSISKTLQVNGTGTFNGAVSAPQITTSDFQLNGDLILTHHITAGGGTPAASEGPALGGGGTASVSGSDTSGAVSINTGNSPAAGCFVTVTFTSQYATTPHILLTPVGFAGAGIEYYAERTETTFSICDATAPPTGASFGFDYFVID